MERKSVARILPLFLLLVGFSLLLILAENFGLISPVRGAIERVTNPLRTGVYRSWQNISGTLGLVGNLGKETKKIAELESQVRVFAVLKVKQQQLEEENKALRRQLEAPMPASMQFLPAKTLSKTRYLILDRGEDDGIKVGMMVVSENILVGKVNSVTPKTSQVLLPWDPDSKISSTTLNTQTHGLATGEFGTSIFLDKVLQSDNLETGDLVVTTGEDDYTRGLLIGKLGKIEKKEVEPFKNGEIIPILDYSQLVNVFVIK